MLVKDLMSTNVITVSPDALVSEIAEIIHKNHFTGVPVVNGDGRVLGTISERDFITATSGLYLPTYIKLLSSMDYVQGGRKGLPRVVDQVVNATAKDIMSQKVPFARPDTTLEQLAYNVCGKAALTLFRLPTQLIKLLGIISRSDLIKFFSPSVVRDSYKPEKRQEIEPDRMIDAQVAYTQTHFTSRFAYVAKARANIWLTATIVLFIVGFLAGIIYVADPNIFTSKNLTTQHP